MIDILIAEDQVLVRQGLKMMLETEAEFRVVAEASNGKEAVEWCQRKSFDLVLLDIRMPEMNGLEAGKIIRNQHPQTIILMLTTFNDEEYALEALKNKANGYLLKDGDSFELIKSVKSALNGGLVIQDHVAARVMPTLLDRQPTNEPVNRFLTHRELDIIKKIGEGKNNQEIADTLYLSVGTVKNHISSILTKLELRDRTQIAIYALKHKIF
ncbi:response regulator [Marinilactibacillus psychrotolerans]|uniref:Two-component system response regulator n=2 Tax=Marinilactibacillus psychrotolerans TaxID=191770 RepID=A0AAV3WVP6_9LACT|nr:response regulator transcription factor [Marinilactibacillus psychrotolerans]GEL67325.1 DNA-binding response regulator [Marinilactibacillus psychrotolerans]GEQ36268.1 two-component system response regulator [Marinilactibacillus psychrotolerans]SDC93123.1 two component transcriptional regulator, LuxR family [Marinilactibacillus psychrotolerans]